MYYYFYIFIYNIYIFIYIIYAIQNQTAPITKSFYCCFLFINGADLVLFCISLVRASCCYRSENLTWWGHCPTLSACFYSIIDSWNAKLVWYFISSIRRDFCRIPLLLWKTAHCDKSKQAHTRRNQSKRTQRSFIPGWLSGLWNDQSKRWAQTQRLNKSAGTCLFMCVCVCVCVCVWGERVHWRCSISESPQIKTCSSKMGLLGLM